MDWIEKIINDFESKHTEDDRDQAAMLQRKQERDRRFEERFEACVNDLMLPVLKEIADRIAARGYPCKLEGPFVAKGISREAPKAEVAFFVNKDRNLKKFDPFSANSITFYTQQLKVKSVIRPLTSPPEERFLELDEITRGRLEQCIAEFLEKVFA